MNLYDENLNYLQKFVSKDIMSHYFRVICRKRAPIISPVDIGSYNYVTECLNAMKNFENNRWWLTDDKHSIAFYQLQTDVMLVSPQVFHDSLEDLLGRQISQDEIETKREELIKEATTRFLSPNPETKVANCVDAMQQKD